MNESYVYIYLNPLKPGIWIYKEFKFDFQPFYTGEGVGVRCYEHLMKSKLESNDSFLKIRTIKSILKEGKKPIILKLVEHLEKQEALKIENEIILHFGRLITNDGILTNLNTGLFGTEYNLPGKDNPKSKIVYQYDLEGNFLKKWNCGIRGIGRELKIDSSTIVSCCLGKSNTSNGYRWYYEYKGDKINKHIITYTPIKKIYAFDLTNTLVHIFNDAREVKEFNSCSRDYIRDITRTNGIYKDLFFSYDKYFTIPLEVLERIKKNGELSLYKRNCPSCNKELFYKNKQSFDSSNSKNKLCISCSSIKLPLEFYLDIKRICKGCGKELVYSTIMNKIDAEVKNSVCRNCSQKNKKTKKCH
jgi:hypothetical protein